MCVCVSTPRYVCIHGVVMSRGRERSERGIDRQIERERGREMAFAREQGCTRVLFACVYDVNIIRQTHLNRLKILASTSRPPPLCELSARCVRLYRSAFIVVSLCR